MDNKDKIKYLKNQYDNIYIPKELDKIVVNAFEKIKKNKRKLEFKRVFIIPVYSMIALVLVINLNGNVSNALEKIPVIGKVIEVVNVRNYIIEDKLSIDVAGIKGLENKELEYEINNDLLEEGKKEYREFVQSMKNSDHRTLDIKYEKLEHGRYLIIKVTRTEIGASGYQTIKYYNIDKEKEVMLTLPRIFKDKEYIDVISENIKKQIKEQIEKNEGAIYFTEGESAFKNIDENQDFYIDKNNQLVISFDEYEIAPGSMGVVEFTIPNEILTKLLIKK